MLFLGLAPLCGKGEVRVLETIYPAGPQGRGGERKWRSHIYSSSIYFIRFSFPDRVTVQKEELFISCTGKLLHCTTGKASVGRFFQDRKDPPTRFEIIAMATLTATVSQHLGLKPCLKSGNG